MKKHYLPTLFTLSVLALSSQTVFAQTSTQVTQIKPAEKAVAQQNNQVPGFYRMKLGDFEVTALYDGYVDLPAKILKGMDESNLQKLFAKMFVESKNGVQTAVNAYLINTGKNLILVDSGAAKCYGPTLGSIQNNIRAAGYELSQIDTVLLTHLHPDHACGIAQEGKMAFPNATVYSSQADADFWLNTEIAAKAPKDMQGIFQMARDSVAAYQQANQFKTYQVNQNLLDGLKIVPSVGHTPGHSSYLFESKGQSLLVIGDIVHSYSVQFSNPEVAIEFDSDNKQAIITRKKIFENAAQNKLWVAGAHLPFPGIGHIRKEGKAFAWIPTEYSPLRSDR